MVDVEMIRSENDKRLYRVIDLDNGLRAMLISSVNCSGSDESGDSEEEWDSTSEDDSVSTPDESSDDNSDDESIPELKAKKSAAALAICRGSLHDPPYIVGIAHYLEHMLFMGSEKYPQENEYEEFLSKHGGRQNAYTDLDATVFHFDVNKSAFPKALDMFANFFINPLLAESSLEREVEAVESEFQLLQVEDDCRIPEMLARQAGPDHPMSKFSCGNLKSLRDLPREQGLNVRDELVNFMKNNYSADKMKLCVQSKHSLDELEEMVRESFAAIPKRELPAVVLPPGLPFVDNPDFFKLFKVVPMRQDLSVTFHWPLPSQKQLYREKNLDYLGYAIGHEGRNSILDHLRKKNWAMELEAGCDQDGFNENEMYSMFEICVILTDEGAENLAQVIRYVYQYIHMLRKKGPQKWLWQELKGIADNDFRFEDETSSLNYVTDLCVAMHDLPVEHYLCGYELYFDYNPQRLQQLTEALAPDRCCITYVDTKFKKETNLFPLKEPWLGVLYKIEDFADDWRKLWLDDAEFQTRFELPEPNPYLATNFDLVSEAEFAGELYPVKLVDGDRGKLWFRKDEKFRVPKLHISAHIITRAIFSGEKNTVCTDITTALLDQTLAEVFNYAEMASLDCDVYGCKSGICIIFNGFSDKLPLLFDTVIAHLVKMDFPQGQFEAVVQELQKNYYNTMYSLGYADELRTSIVLKGYVPVSRRRQLAPGLKRQDVFDLIAEIRKTSFVELYVHGNATAAVARKLLTSIEDKLQASPSCKSIYQSHAKIEGQNYVRFLALNAKDENSRIINYYQHKPVDLAEKTMMHLLESLLDEKCFNELRTKQQLSYDVSFRTTDSCHVVGICVAVSPAASKFTLTHVDEKIDEFMTLAASFIDNLSEKEFVTAREALIQLKSCADLAMDDEHYRFWNQIASFEYCFDVLLLEVNFLKSLSLAQFVSWSRKVLQPADGFRKLSVQLVGYGEKALAECEGGEQIWKEHLRSNDGKQVDEDAAQMPPLKLLTPKDAKGKTFVTDFDEFQSKLQYYQGEYRDPRKPFCFD